VLIRAAIAANVPVIEQIVCGAYAKYIERIGKKPGPMLDDYAARVAAGEVSVCVDDATIAGLIVLEPASDHLLLDNIAVAPTQQGRGVGRMLLAFADAEAQRRGYRELRLYTHELMHENQAFYTRLGWQEYARAEQDGFRRLFMRRPV
jgi:ribosomal protein S18 acetylase RimI-like enzyme